MVEQARAKTSEPDPLRRAALVRAVSAVTALTREQSETSLGDAVAAPSDIQMLWRMLSTPEALDILRRDDPLIDARLRGIAARDDVLHAEGGTVDVSAAAHMAGISRQAMERRRQRRTVLALSMGRRGYRYPVWQFTPSGVLPGLESVVRLFADDGGWAAANWLLARNSRLGARPLDLLRQGEIEEVGQAARAYGEQGA
jgi:uncharacterized protein YunC (DUF1805 family)